MDTLELANSLLAPPRPPQPPAGSWTLSQLVAAIRDRGEPHAFRALQRWCRGYIRGWHWQGFNQETWEEIVGQAIAEAWPTIEKHDVSEEQIAGALRRPLDKFKKRAQRSRDRSTPLIEQQLRVTRSHEEDVVVRRTLRQVVGVIVDEMTDALRALSDRDHDLVVLHYGLDVYFSPRSQGLEALNGETRRKALQRARKRFNESLEAELRSALPSIPGQYEPALALALRVIRGDLLVDVLKLVSDRRKPVCRFPR